MSLAVRLRFADPAELAPLRSHSPLDSSLSGVVFHGMDHGPSRITEAAPLQLDVMGEGAVGFPVHTPIYATTNGLQGFQNIRVTALRQQPSAP